MPRKREVNWEVLSVGDGCVGGRDGLGSVEVIMATGYGIRRMRRRICVDREDWTSCWLVVVVVVVDGVAVVGFKDGLVVRLRRGNCCRGFRGSNDAYE
jgi:hypothetical protein